MVEIFVHGKLKPYLCHIRKRFSRFIRGRIQEGYPETPSGMKIIKVYDDID